MPAVVATETKITYWKGSALIHVQGPALEGSGQKGGLRKEVKGMSDASRRRLKEKLAQVQNSERQNALAVCLTYPRNVVKPEEWETYKNHVRVFNQAVKRRYPDSSGIWVLEFQKSGAPHFHLLVFGLKGHHNLAGLRTWMQQRWYEVAHAGDVHMGRAGTRVEWVKSGGGVMGYMAKYMSKNYTNNRAGYTGRMWGKFGELPLGKEETLQLTPEQTFKVMRWARKKVENDVENSRWNNFLRAEWVWQRGNRLFWENLKSAWHGSGHRWFNWMNKQSFGDGTEYWHACRTMTTMVAPKRAGGLEILPKRWKARNNDRVRLICDADAFMDSIKQGMARGLL